MTRITVYVKAEQPIKEMKPAPSLCKRGSQPPLHKSYTPGRLQLSFLRIHHASSHTSAIFSTWNALPLYSFPTIPCPYAQAQVIETEITISLLSLSSTVNFRLDTWPLGYRLHFPASFVSRCGQRPSSGQQDR